MSHTNNTLDAEGFHKSSRFPLTDLHQCEFCGSKYYSLVECPDCGEKRKHDEIKLHIHRQADLMTRTRVNKIKELLEKNGHKVTIVTR